MAHIVLGLAGSHSTMAHTPPALWSTHARGADMPNNALISRDGRPYDYATLLAQADPAVAALADESLFDDRYQRIQAAIAAQSRMLAEARPDLVIVVGEDQHEMFGDDNMPAVLVYWGEQIPSIPRQTSTRHPPELQASLKAAAWGYGTAERQLPIDSDFSLHLIRSLMDDDFDVSASRRIAAPSGASHAFGFVYQRIMGEHVVPHVPLMINTFHPPNQLSPRRCYQLGLALRRAIDAWPHAERVAIVASGGLSHFVVNEELDHQVLDALQRHDADAIQAIPRELMQSGTSEILNWVVLAGAVGTLRMEVMEYLPCYRSPAGTGVGMGYACWS